MADVYFFRAPIMHAVVRPVLGMLVMLLLVEGMLAMLLCVVEMPAGGMLVERMGVERMGVHWMPAGRMVV